jgi:hypothetical protein
MVARGHCLETLLNEYPISTLRDMMKAAAHNHRENMAVHTQGTSTAVLHGMDCGFNKGKGKILQKFMKALFKQETKSKDMGDVEKSLFSLLGPRK